VIFNNFIALSSNMEKKDGFCENNVSTLQNKSDKPIYYEYLFFSVAN